MRDLAHVQTQILEQGFRISGQPSGAQLGARIMPFFQEQDVVRKMRGVMIKVQGGRESGRSAAQDEHVVRLWIGFHTGIVAWCNTPFGKNLRGLCGNPWRVVHLFVFQHLLPVHHQIEFGQIDEMIIRAVVKKSRQKSRSRSFTCAAGWMHRARTTL